MKLFLNDTSPFARLVLIAIEEYSLDKPQLIWVNPWEFSQNLVEVNPFSMVPTLVTKDQQSIYDSLIIINYLCQQKNIQVDVSDHALFGYGKTLLDTAFRYVSLVRYTPADQSPHPFIPMCLKMLQGALSVLPEMDKSQTDMRGASLEQLQLITALAYIQFRIPELAECLNASLEQRSIHAAWFNRDSFIKTAPDCIKDFRFSAA